MRERIQRGKRTDNREWVQGDLVRHYENQRRFIACDQLAYTYAECGISRLVSERFYEVDPETVGDYTGIPDKNGVKIFEGDIVKNEYNYGYVEYGKGSTMFFINQGDEYPTPLLQGWIKQDVEVVGNIYDNPELIKEESK